MQEPDAYTLDLDGKGKGRPAGRAYVVGCVGGLIIRITRPAGALHDFSTEIRAPSAIAQQHGRFGVMTMRQDDLRVRPGRISHGNRGAKRLQSFAGEVIRAAKPGMWAITDAGNSDRPS